MEFCQLVKTGATKEGQTEFVCAVCKLPYWSRRDDASRIHRPCGVSAGTMPPAPIMPRPMPSLREKLANFTVAAIGHVMSGAPTCTDEEIAKRLTICRGCEHFVPDKDNPEIGACDKCGCPVSDLLPKFVSKLAWSDQHCPVGNW